MTTLLDKVLIARRNQCSVDLVLLGIGDISVVLRNVEEIAIAEGFFLVNLELWLRTVEII